MVEKWNRTLVCFLEKQQSKKKGHSMTTVQKKPIYHAPKQERNCVFFDPCGQVQVNQSCKQKSHELRGVLFIGHSCSSTSTPEVRPCRLQRRKVNSYFIYTVVRFVFSSIGTVECQMSTFTFSSELIGFTCSVCTLIILHVVCLIVIHANTHHPS